MIEHNEHIIDWMNANEMHESAPFQGWVLSVSRREFSRLDHMLITRMAEEETGEEKRA